MSYPVNYSPLNQLANPYGMSSQQNQSVGSSNPQSAAPQPAAARPYPYWASPTQWVNSARTVGSNVRDELQKAFPGEYAHLIGWQPLKSAQMNAKDTVHVLKEVSQHHPVKDHELITFDDNMKRAASLGIATLATLGLKQGVFGVGEFLGMGSWFGAMAATPKLINTMVNAKTGVNLNQKYDSTEGQRLNLYQDPNYLPLHLLSKEQEDQAARRLHIPDGPNRRRELEEKVRQVSVQAHTWGMLAAGVATPVISGLACDLLQDSAMNGMNKAKLFYHRMEADRMGGGKTIDPEKMATRTKAYLAQITGESPESELSRWWKDFGQGLVKTAGLDAMEKEYITKKSRIEQRKKLATMLAELAQPGNGRLEKVNAFLDKQFAQKEENGEDVFSGRIHRIEEKASDFLDRFKNKLEEKDIAEAQANLQTRLINAKTTLGHYRQIFKVIEDARPTSGQLDENALNRLSTRLEGMLLQANIQNVQNKLLSRLNEAKLLVNHDDTFKKIEKNLSNSVRKSDTASKLMGATPEVHLLDDALKSLKLGRMWRTRMGLYLGGGVLGATAVYNFTMVGRDFKKPSPKLEPGKTNGGPR